MAGNQPFADRFTLLHLASGFILARLNVSLPHAVALAVIFELAEPSIKENLPQIFPDPSQDSWVNKVGDVLAVALGWWLSKRSG